MENAKDRAASSLDGDLTDDERAYVEYGEALRDAVTSALAPWLARQLTARTGRDESEFVDLIDKVALDVRSRLDELIYADVDLALSGPLERIRLGVEAVGGALAEAGVEPPQRDPFDVKIRPNDHYGLGPLTFADLGEEVHNAGIAWGAAKAYLHQARRR